MAIGQVIAPRIAFLTKELNGASPLTNGTSTLWTYHGGIWIHGLYGCVTTQIQAQATNTKLSVKNGTLTAVDLCANLDITGAAPGTLLSLPAAPASALIATPLGAAYTLPALPFLMVAPTTGIITVTHGAASTGAIVWSLVYTLASPSSTLV